MPRAVLTPGQRERIRAAKGHSSAREVGAAFGVSESGVLNIWSRTSDKPRRLLTDAARELIVAGRGAGHSLADLIRISGFSETTVSQVLRDARAEGDLRADPNADIRAAAVQQRAAAKAAHREGGKIPSASPAALAPNSVERSLMARGIPLAEAREAAKVWAARHGAKNAGQGR
jgi:hypothetical protein